MANRWISYSRAAEIIKDYYDSGINKKFPEIVINKSKIQRFEKLLENVLEHDLMDDANTIKDIPIREYFYKVTFLAEEYTNLLKKLRKEDGNESLDYIADYIFSNSQIAEEIDNLSSHEQIIEYINNNLYTFHTIENLEKVFPKFHINENLDKGFYKDLYDFLSICNYGHENLVKNINVIFHKMALILSEYKKNNDLKMYQDVLNENLDKYFENNPSLGKKIEVEEFYVEYKLDTSMLRFNEAVSFLLKLKFFTLLMNRMLTKQWVSYSVFSEIPVLDTSGQMSVYNIVRMTTSCSDLKELKNKIRRLQRLVKKDYDLFVKKMSPKIEVEKLKHMKYYFVQLIVLSEEIKEENEIDEEIERKNKYIKIVKETKNIIYRLINDEHLTHKELDHLTSFIVYKDMEYYLKEKTFDFMKIRIIEESKINKEVIDLLIKTIEENFLK